MGFGIEFKGVNRHLGAPKGMTEEQCYTLPVMYAEDLDTPIVGSEEQFHTCSISCWQLTSRELEELKNNGGKVYLKVSGGQPPVNITPFIDEYNLDTSKFDGHTN